MPVTCPKCQAHFKGQSIGSHAKKCGLTLAELFWNRVNKDAIGGCWLWTASTKEKGYGQYHYQGKMHRAHRLAWTLSGRELPPRPLELAHSCDNRLCVNPDHLSAATHDENMADCKAKRRHAHGERSRHAKLTEVQVRQIRQLYKKTAPRKGNAREVAAMFGVSVGIIHKIGRGESWRYVK